MFKVAGVSEVPDNFYDLPYLVRLRVGLVNGILFAVFFIILVALPIYAISP